VHLAQKLHVSKFNYETVYIFFPNYVHQHLLLISLNYEEKDFSRELLFSPILWVYLKEQ